MPKTIVICSDGTGNSDTGRVPSNVKRLFDLLVQDSLQIAIYDAGVGTARRQRGENPISYWLHHLAELAFGVGVAENLLELYSYLVRHYDDGDRVFLFGFSRGAFTVRALAGLVHVCGLLRRDRIDLASHAVRLYEESEQRIITRRRERGCPPAFGGSETDHGATDDVAAGFKAAYGRPCQVDFLGIWDTVKAYGWVRPRSFPALRHNPIVRTVRHAAALDERRALFQMTGWGDSHSGVREVWFAGDHADVGGGHRDGNSPLTDASLWWMLGAATHAGLRLKDEPTGTLESIARGCARAPQEPARSLWIKQGFILLDFFLPRQELDNAQYPPLRPWRLFWLNGARKPGDHAFLDTVSVHHTVDKRPHAGKGPYSRARLVRRSRAGEPGAELALQVVEDAGLS